MRGAIQHNKKPVHGNNALVITPQQVIDGTVPDFLLKGVFKQALNLVVMTRLLLSG